ncbi:Lrp/AsnC family transcriptional regulator [Leucobacter sp. wl10]|uniref:Lrp/AsnC family transcriptional regulator n=1 Tax=Leucobacter sp. wl10 TaxID=2304677 RepID=UPI000E5A39B3|nr:Lrp/AsnC family transcriptional regulator [Leucobacter sp. wl10]RGE23243.1 Lrp/AsnC family transcriptional regulator [Leucobacter sp. wl10]
MHSLDPEALDDLDRRILHALQIEPRVSWSRLATVLGSDSGTLARRWARLSEEGLAWITGYAADRLLALIEIQCEPVHRPAIAEQLSLDPSVMVLDHASGGRDLLALVLPRSFDELSSLVLNDLASVVGVRTMQTHPAGETLIEGGSWRLRSLLPEEVARIPEPRPPRQRAARHVSDDVRRAILDAVWEDGRIPVSVMAERSGISPQRISDGLATMRHDDVLRFRTDIARRATDWPVYAWYFIEAPSTVIEAARSTITSVPEVRLAFTSASRYNLVLAVWLRRLSDVNRFELALERALAGVRIADRAVVLRTTRHMNRLLGPDTRATGPAPGDRLRAAA